MGPTWGPSGSCRPQMGPILAPWTLLSGSDSLYIPCWSANDVVAKYWCLCVPEVTLKRCVMIYHAGWSDWFVMNWACFHSMAEEALRNHDERRPYGRNIFSHWLRPYPIIKENGPWTPLPFRKYRSSQWGNETSVSSFHVHNKNCLHC